MKFERNMNTRNINYKEVSMDIVNEIMPMLFEIVELKGCAVNLSREKGEVVINVMRDKKTRTFRSTNGKSLVTDLKYYLQA